VESHLVSDVPVGVLLSGGVDSSAIVALMSQMGQGRFSTFSVGFQGAPSFTELPFARKVATQFGTSHRELEVGPKDLIDMLPSIVTHLDEPLTDPAVVPTYLLSKMAGAYVKVVLSGEGADELFGGYRRYSLDWLASWYQQVPSGMRTRLLDWFRKTPVDRRMVQGVRALTQDSPAKRHLEWVGAFSFDELCEVTKGPEAVEAEAHRLESLFEPYFAEGTDQAAAVAGMLRADLSTWLPDDLLTKVDRMTMAASLEARVPYLDHPLVEMVADIPARVKFRDGVPKAVLKAAVGDLLPKDILTRKKMGFDAPLAQWMRGPMKEFIVDVLRTDGPPGLFNPAGVKRALSEHLEGKQDRSRQLWSLAVVTLWYQALGQEKRTASEGTKAA
jgi:asparagine synthase (glutamine-hydrolysing)